MEEEKKTEWRDVEVWCPTCGEYVKPSAHGYSLEHACLPVVAERDRDGKLLSGLDWDSADIEIDFVYECDKCGTRLFGDLDELDRMFTRKREDGSMEARVV